MTALVAVPVVSIGSAAITEGGKPVWAAGKFVGGVAGVKEAEEQTIGAVTFMVESGSYSFAQ